MVEFLLGAGVVGALWLIDLHRRDAEERRVLAAFREALTQMEKHSR